MVGASSSPVARSARMRFLEPCRLPGPGASRVDAQGRGAGIDGGCATRLGTGRRRACGRPEHGDQRQHRAHGQHGWHEHQASVGIRSLFDGRRGREVRRFERDLLVRLPGRSERRGREVRRLAVRRAGRGAPRRSDDSHAGRSPPVLHERRDDRRQGLRGPSPGVRWAEVREQRRHRRDPSDRELGSAGPAHGHLPGTSSRKSRGECPAESVRRRVGLQSCRTWV